VTFSVFSSSHRHVAVGHREVRDRGKRREVSDRGGREKRGERQRRERGER
jgi:hypothetical protein